MAKIAPIKAKATIKIEESGSSTIILKNTTINQFKELSSLIGKGSTIDTYDSLILTLIKTYCKKHHLVIEEDND